MGNYLSCGVPIRVSDTSSTMEMAAIARVIHTDGGIEEVVPPLSVAELMLEHPRFFVCEIADDDEILHQDNVDEEMIKNSHRHRPLPADHQLAAGHLYCLLPKSLLRGRHSGPLKQPQKNLRSCGNEKKGFVDQSKKEVDEEAEDEDANLLELQQMAFNMRIMSRCASWRPKLETIDECIY